MIFTSQSFLQTLYIGSDLIFCPYTWTAIFEKSMKGTSASPNGIIITFIQCIPSDLNGDFNFAFFRQVNKDVLYKVMYFDLNWRRMPWR